MEGLDSVCEEPAGGWTVAAVQAPGYTCEPTCANALTKAVMSLGPEGRAALYASVTSDPEGPCRATFRANIRTTLTSIGDDQTCGPGLCVVRAVLRHIVCCIDCTFESKKLSIYFTEFTQLLGGQPLTRVYSQR